MLRAAVTGNLPDVYFSGYNLTAELVHTLAPRKQITDLAPFIEKDGGQAFLDKNYSPKMSALGMVDGKQYGLPVNASNKVQKRDLLQIVKSRLAPASQPA